ncbi:MAG: hypothetical protein BWY32_00848 [bacterium ADurb.Bin243]|nr:MAG: hypothetical protein BWY32_00848 [bacterium ADurb.Bin243]HOD39571.1 sulfite exporter TauE/SafE family protein [Candidatus Wallbacteria bacterium]
MDSFVKAFMLGLSLSPVCLFTCTPLVVPYVLSGGNGFLESLKVSANFLLGRFAGYMAVGTFAWYISKAIFKNAVTKNVISGISFFVLAAFLLHHALIKSKNGSCGCGADAGDAPSILNGYFSKTALGLGFLTAFNICPPILIAVFEAANRHGLMSALFFYVAFFTGSSIYFIIVPFLGAACRGKTAVNIGRVCAVVIGAYYLYQGVFKTVGGLALMWK